MPNSRIYAVDPGPERSGFVLLQWEGAALPRICRAVKLANQELLDYLWHIEEPYSDTVLVAEQIQGMGMTVGSEVFETCFWTGRFVEGWCGPWDRVTRRQVKLNLCGSMRAKDPQVRQVLIDRFGPGKDKAIGTKKTPGPLYGVAGDCWSALAVGMTWRDEQIAARRLIGNATIQQ